MTPQLQSLGSLTQLTLGSGGSSIDGNGYANQRGKGNDGRSGTVGGFGNNQGKPRGRR